MNAEIHQIPLIYFQGDSGGPLVMDNELVGLTNWAVLCARGVPDGFARISYLYEWIEAHTKA